MCWAHGCFHTNNSQTLGVLMIQLISDISIYLEIARLRVQYFKTVHLFHLGHQLKVQVISSTSDITVNMSVSNDPFLAFDWFPRAVHWTQRNSLLIRLSVYYKIIPVRNTQEEEMNRETFALKPLSQCLHMFIILEAF